MIEKALRKTSGNKQKAAQVLGLSREGLNKKLKQLASVRDFRSFELEYDLYASTNPLFSTPCP